MQLFGFPFTVEVADIDETMDPAKPPREEVARVSLLKARAIECGDDDIVIAADTIVVLGNRVLGKPKDEADAFSMLRMLSGQTHQVMTGMTVLCGDRVVTHTEITDVTFRPLSDREILNYIATKEPMDKAGSYGIQQRGSLFVEKINGDYFNVVGLPVCRLGQILEEFQ